MGSCTLGTRYPGLEYPLPGTGVPPPPGKDMGPLEVWDGDGVPFANDMGPVEVLWDGYVVNPPPPKKKDMGPVGLRWGTPPLPPTRGDGQTENITSRRTSYAGGKKPEVHKFPDCNWNRWNLHLQLFLPHDTL